MKKRTLLTVGLVLLLMGCFVPESLLAAADLPEKPDNAEKIIRDYEETDIIKQIRESVRSSEESQPAEMSGLSFPQTDDTVTINDDTSIDVITQDGISMKIYPPFGTVALTQDMLAQLDVYAMFDDPVEICNSLMEMGTHIYIADLVSFMDIHISTVKDIVGVLVSDIDDLTEADKKKMTDSLSKMHTDVNIYPKQIGEHTFFVYEIGDDYRIYETVKNGITIDINVISGGDRLEDYDIESVEIMLEDAVFEAE